MISFDDAATRGVLRLMPKSALRARHERYAALRTPARALYLPRLITPPRLIRYAIPRRYCHAHFHLSRRYDVAAAATLMPPRLYTRCFTRYACRFRRRRYAAARDVAPPDSAAA